MYRPLALLLLGFLTGCGTFQFSSTSRGSGSASGGQAKPPSAYVYVSSSTASNTYQIQGYTAGALGSLKAISGSPFDTTGFGPLDMGTTGSHLFGADGYKIYSYSIAADGALSVESSIVAGEVQNGEPIAGPAYLFFDPSASTLYSFYYNLDGPDSVGYGAYSFDSSNGSLTEIDTAGGSAENSPVVGFARNNQYMFTSDAYHGQAAITEYTRAANGGITQTNPDVSFTSPTAPSGAYYLPYDAVGDGSDHIIVAMGQATSESFSPNGPWQLAVYSVGPSGNLTTTSTYENMTTVNVGETVNWYAFSPDYKYFAICGSNGLQVFAYNAANTTFTAVDTTEEPSDNIVKVVWDGNNHLYALDAQSNSLFVYTVTDTAVTAVSGSPYAVQNPADLAVSSLTGGS
jgi:hypothetical protein